MSTRRTILGVLTPFLDSYTSRYSDFEGYWLFGCLPEDFVSLTIDLIGKPECLDASPEGVAIRLAIDKFCELYRKAGLKRSQLLAAQLSISKTGPIEGSVNGTSKIGSNFHFLVQAVMDNERHFHKHKVVFVAPHDSLTEFRRSQDVAKGSRHPEI